MGGYGLGFIGFIGFIGFVGGSRRLLHEWLSRVGSRFGFPK